MDNAKHKGEDSSVSELNGDSPIVKKNSELAKPKRFSKDYTFTDETIKEVAKLNFIGMNPCRIAKEIGTSAYGVNKIMKDPRFAAAHSTIVDVNVSAIQEMFKKHLTEFMGLTIERLKEELSPGSRGGIEAIKIVLKSCGLLENVEDPKTKDSKINIILPKL